MESKISINKENKIYANLVLDFTHDYEDVKIGSIMINRYGDAYEITNIVKNECGRNVYWSNENCLCEQYYPHHNMRTKPPFYAYQFKVKQ